MGSVLFSSGAPVLSGANSQSLISLEGSNFAANGHIFLSDVPENITLTPSLYTGKSVSSGAGSFVGFDSKETEDRHAVPIGKLRNIKFMSIFRFKARWTTHWVGSNGRDLEHETHMVMLDKSDDSDRPYVLLLPLLEGSFRASFQPGDDDNVDVCVESGSTQVCGAGFRSVVYMHGGDDPYNLMKEAMKVVRMHLGTFKLLEEKTPPGIVDKFGWCTWDAFYLTVHPQDIWEGVKGLVEGGCPPGLVLIDDGWQSISHDEDPITEEGINATIAGEQMPCTLLKFQENYKFRDYVSPKSLAIGAKEKGMGAFIKDLKEEFTSVDSVYVWHALCGYWGGLRPNVPGLPPAQVVKPVLSPGLEMTMKDLAVEKILSTGVGLVPPEIGDQMFEGLHSHLEKAGIDGVKVDVFHMLEMVRENYGGRVDMAKAYFKAFTASVRKHFKGNGVIASMEQCNDFMFLGTEAISLGRVGMLPKTSCGTEAISLGRVGDDFWCTDPSGDPNETFWLQGCHMVHCAYNSLWMGNFIQPDWDMFQSTHPCAEFHAASRAISGGPIYVSDAVGEHNFPLLKKLVLSDGSILRCDYHALPTRDCLFENPLHDGRTMLKIWNLNKFTGVIGAFNCQGGGLLSDGSILRCDYHALPTRECLFENPLHDGNTMPKIWNVNKFTEVIGAFNCQGGRWCRETRRNQCASRFSHLVMTKTNPRDIEWNSSKNPISIEGVHMFAMYLSQSKKLVLSKPYENVELALEPFKFELITVSPVTILDGKPVQFAPIGLVNMLNNGGAIQSLAYTSNTVQMGIKGSGEMRVFASEKPRACKIDGREVAFAYGECMVTTQVPWSSPSGLSIVEYLF